MEGSSFLRGLSGKIFKANLSTVLLFGVLWLAIILYYHGRNNHLDDIRISADHVTIDLLGALTAEKEFLSRDLSSPSFFEAETGSGALKATRNLVDWETSVASLRTKVQDLERQIDRNADFDADAMRRLPRAVDEYAAHFRELVHAYHGLGFDSTGSFGTLRKAVQDIETAFKGSADLSLQLLLLEVERDQQEYFLRLNPARIEEVKQDLVELRKKVEGLPTRAAVSPKVDEFEKAFGAILGGQKRIGVAGGEGLLSSLRSAAVQAEDSARKLSARASDLDEEAAARFPWMLGLGGLAGLGIAGVIGAMLGKGVAAPIMSLAANCQSAAAELQAAANQQATGTKEQSTSMNEISTTINELLASSRQIAESARRVAQIAEHAGTAARSGETTVQKSQDSIGGIRRQVDLIVTHMLDLGRKSQEIGGVLEIINELAEQTNILSINATIEAAGGGEAGKRFGVVADEIRKLADRVGTSTKEIQGMIEEVRSAVNATVMTTETGSKAVDSGAQQFSEVTAAFKQIVQLVGTNSEAGREIELTTKQQATAVEQVNAGVLTVGQATREMEASTAQTFQTATQLATLSRDLSRLVNPSTNGRA